MRAHKNRSIGETSMKTPVFKDLELIDDGWVKKYIVSYTMPDGSLHSYEVASRKSPDEYRALLEANGAGTPPASADAICVVAHTTDDALLMIREFRYPLNSWCIAFPAGLLEVGEDFVECANRELQEETGYSIVPGSKVTILPQAGYSSTGLTDETVQIIFVEAEKTGDAHTEKNELIEVFELPVAQIRAFLDENTLPIGIRAQLVLEMVAQSKE